MGKVRKLTVEMVHQKILDKFNGKYKVLKLDTYDGNPQEYVDVLCTTCNTVFKRIYWIYIKMSILFLEIM